MTNTRHRVPKPHPRTGITTRAYHSSRFDRQTVPVNAPDDFFVRRVGFRAGTDDELTALHAVEAPVEAERRPDRVPQPVESYIAFARKLPSQFEDHAWLVESVDGT